MRRAVTGLGAVVGVVLVLLIIAPPASAKSFDLRALSTRATLLPDATMTVAEEITYDFSGGPFTTGIRSFEPRSRPQITGLAVTDESGNALRVLPPGNSTSGEWEWKFAPTSDARRTFTITYTVVDAASVGPDVGELYWKFLGVDHPGVGNVKVVVGLPGDFPPASPTTPDTDTEVVRAWAHGPRNGAITNTGQQVDLAVRDVPAGEFVEARIAVPSAAFTVAPQGGPRLPTILREERAFIDDREAADQRARAGNLAAPVVALGGVGAFLAVWWKWGKEPKAPELGDYWREPLDDPPAITVANLSFGTVPSSAFSSTVIDLAQRGHLTIEEERRQQLGPDTTEYHFVWKGNAKDPLLEHERELLEQLFQGRARTSSTEFAAWARTNPGPAQAFWQEWKGDVRTELDTRGYLERGRSAPWVAWAAVVALLIGGGVVALALGGLLGLIPLAAGIVVLCLGGLMRRRTTRGAAKAEEAKALKRFLKDFSTLDEAPVASLAIWERYLVAAVTLGVAGDLVRGLAIKVPEVAASSSFATWYVLSGGGLGRLDGMSRFGGDFGTAAVSALAPSSTGSGGGFSGGGGGGGGGGGFGAD